MISSRWTTILILAAWSCSARAIGLGPIQLESALGQPLSATVPILETAQNGIASSCVKAKIESLDGILLANARVSVSSFAARSVAVLTSTETINEPAISVRVSLECGGRVQRSYSLLLDFPASKVADSAPGKAQSRSAMASTLDAAKGSSSANRAKGPADRSQADRGTAKPKTATSAARPNTSAEIKRDFARLAKRQDEKRISQSVLRLSGDAKIFTADLKMSGVLSSSPAAGEGAQAVSESLRAARSHLASVLRGEDAILAAALENDAARNKISSLEIERVSLVRDKEAATLALSDLSRKSYPATWMAVLSGLLIFSLGTAGWFALRLKRVAKPSPEWWKSNNVVVDDLDELSPLEKERPEPIFDTAAFQKASPAGLAPDFANGSWGAGSGAQHALQPAMQAASREPVPLRMTASDSHEFRDTIGSSADGYRDDGRHASVEEVADIVQEAEFWMLLNDPQRALQMLEPHAKDDRPESPITWLYLLDLYRQTDNQEKYQLLTDRFKRIFNARIPKWEDDLADVEKTSLEDFPGLLDRICSVWGDVDAAVGLLESLLVDDRNGERAGFDLPVYRDIILLIGVAQEASRVRQ
jgi:pilus assembly protein FimV